MPSSRRWTTSSSPGARITVDVDPDLKVLADPLILDELLANLLANAERHGGPNVHLSATRSTRSGKRLVGVTVADDGPGVEAALLPHLFQPLRHSLTSPTRSGLGLALVRQMAITLGGDVAYEAGRSPRRPVHLLPGPGLSGPDEPCAPSWP